MRITLGVQVGILNIKVARRTHAGQTFHHRGVDVVLVQGVRAEAVGGLGHLSREE